jgi:hypothetical protein
VHQVVQRQGELVLSEAVVGAGGLLGATQVDDNFKRWVRGHVGPVAFDAWCEACPQELLMLLREWEGIKCRFARGVAAPSGPVQIPQTLLEEYMSREDQMALVVDEEVSQGYDDRLFMDEGTMRGFFDPVLEAVAGLVESRLHSRADVRVDRVLLVGGFSKSRYLQEYMREKLAGPLDVVVPAAPHSAVMLGAWTISTPGGLTTIGCV